MTRMILGLSMVVAGAALAQAPAAVVTAKAPVFKSAPQLACPAGTRQMTANAGTQVGCARTVKGVNVFTGPSIQRYDSGAVEAVGDLKDGLRTGKWQMFDEAGNLVAETEFLNDNFHGRRVHFDAQGNVTLEENWVNGKREGRQMQLVKGVAVVTNYSGDRPVQQ